MRIETAGLRRWMARGRQGGLLPQPFLIDCPCGAQVTGQRGPRAMQAVCGRCGSALFVSARSVFSAPAAQTVAIHSEGVRVDGANSRETVAGQVLRPQTKTAGAAAADALDAAVARLPGAAPHQSLDEVRGARRTWQSLQALLKMRLASIRARLTWRLGFVVAALAFVTISSLWSWQRWSHSSAAIALELNLSAGREALKAGDLPTATRQLAIAAVAARRLGQDTSAERWAAQLYRESLVWERLAAESPERFFLARAARLNSDPQQVRQQFIDAFRGRSIIVAAEVSLETEWQEPAALPAVAGPRRSTVDRSPTAVPVARRLRCSWQVASAEATIELALENFPATVGAQTDDPRLTVWGAELLDIRPVRGRPGHWELILSPGSVVPLTERGPFVAAGWELDASLDAALERQAQQVGTEP